MQAESGFLYFVEVHPSQRIAFEGVVGGRGTGRIVVASIVHDVVDSSHHLCAIGGIVVVGKSEHVSELVAEGADTGGLDARISVDFASAGISVDDFVVEGKFDARM